MAVASGRQITNRAAAGIGRDLDSAVSSDIQRNWDAEATDGWYILRASAI
jgi:hypothetical protein